MSSAVREFLGDERGQETTEFAIMAALIVVAVIVVIGGIGLWVEQQFDAFDVPGGDSGGGSAPSPGSDLGKSAGRPPGLSGHGKSPGG